MNRRWALIGVAVAVVGCSDSFKPSVEDVSGGYELMSFTIDSAGTRRDLLAAGASLDMILLPLGDVVGQLNIPGESGAFFASLNGSWTLSGNIVHFTQTADTFVRDVDWIATKDRLSGDETFGDVRVRVVLKRNPGPSLP